MEKENTKRRIKNRTPSALEGGDFWGRGWGRQRETEKPEMKQLWKGEIAVTGQKWEVRVGGDRG